MQTRANAEDGGLNRSSLPPKLVQLLEVLDLLPDRGGRIDILISIADRFREVSPEIASRPFAPEQKVPACESQAYAFAAPRADSRLDFHFAVENPQGISAMALAEILSDTLSGASLRQVAKLEDKLVTEIFGQELSTGKRLGLLGMLSMVRTYALRAIAESGGQGVAEHGPGE